eukprot:360589-Chlamydomonas_euryale.AAC.4
MGSGMGSDGKRNVLSDPRAYRAVRAAYVTEAFSAACEERDARRDSTHVHILLLEHIDARHAGKGTCMACMQLGDLVPAPAQTALLTFRP